MNNLLPQRRRKASSPEPSSTRMGGPNNYNDNNNRRGRYNNKNNNDMNATPPSSNSSSAATPSSSPYYSRYTPSFGISSYLATARRRWNSSRDEGGIASSSTLLPTTYSSLTSNSNSSSMTNGKSSKRSHNNNNSNNNNHLFPHYPSGASSSSSSSMPSITCNSFLMGGHYYPGKDKKRRHLRKRTFWYKMFWSSNWRKVLTTISMSYVMVFYILLPIKDSILEYGQLLSASHAKQGDWLQYDSTLHMTKPQKEQELAIDLASERANIQYTYKRFESRRDELANILPKFFYRNNPDGKAINNNHEKKEIQDTIQMKHQDDDNSNESLNANNKDTSETTTTTTGQNNPGGTENANDKAENSISQNGAKMPSAHESHKSKHRLKRSGAQPAANIQINTDTTPDQQQEKQEQQLLQLQQQQEKLQQQMQQLQQEQQHQGQEQQSPVNNRRLIQVQPPNVIRTIHNMDTMTNLSSCPSHLDQSNIQTTLVTQASKERLWLLKHTCQRWKDPIVAVVFSSGDNDTQEIEAIATPLAESCPNLKIMQYIGQGSELETSAYPVNRLRNVGLDAVTTSHVMIMDIDFVPSMGLNDIIKETLKSRYSNNDNNSDTLIPTPSLRKEAVVVPAFERLPPEPCETYEQCRSYTDTDSSFLPKSFDDLKLCVQNKECISFQSNVNWEGHYTTNSNEWLEQKWYQSSDGKTKGLTDGTASTLKTIDCFHTLRYEPYVVLRWCPVTTTTASSVQEQQQQNEDQVSLNNNGPQAPYYDERFYGYGKNKIEMISHIRRMGYQFIILPKGFIIHSPHPESAVKEKWNNRKDESKLHQSMDSLYPKFLKELDDKYKHYSNHTIHMCDRK